MTHIAVDGCLFCQIVAHKVSANVIRETAWTMTFTDISPQAPVHVLVITKDHYANLEDLSGEDPGLLGTLMAEVAVVADDQGLGEDGYRVVINTGEEGGQTVEHVHAHVLGGRAMTWPPG
jgi:histidine triad (HIT) family protein